MNKDEQPIDVDDAYKIRDNQFWYNDCKFRHLVENKKSIKINIDGLGTRTLMHSKKGVDKRITLSYTFPSSEDRKWWEENRGEFVRVKLIGINC